MYLHTCTWVRASDVSVNSSHWEGENKLDYNPPSINVTPISVNPL